METNLTKLIEESTTTFIELLKNGEYPSALMVAESITYLCEALYAVRAMGCMPKQGGEKEPWE